MKAFVLGLVAVAGVVFALDIVAGPVLSWSVRDTPPMIRGERVVGTLEGPVKSADQHASVVRVASGFLGLSSLPLVVTPETTIAVGGKLGWWGDLRRGLQVRVAYEVLPDARLVASRVDVLENGSSPSASVGTMRDDPTVPPPPPPPTAVVNPAAQHVNAPSDQPGTPPTAAVVAAPVPPARAVRPPRGPKSARAAARTTPAGSPPAPAPQRPASEPSSTEDGGAAIDWLLRGSPARPAP